jgi:integrase
MLHNLQAKEQKDETNEPKKPHVFHGLSSEMLSVDTYDKAWQSACRKCGYMINDKKGNIVPKFKKHDLRRTRILTLQSSGVPLKLIQQMVGHSAASMTFKYTQHASEEMESLAFDLDRIDSEAAEKAASRKLEAEKMRKLADEKVNGWSID